MAATFLTVFNRFSSNFQDIVVTTCDGSYFTGVMIWSFLSDKALCKSGLVVATPSGEFHRTFRILKKAPFDIDQILFGSVGQNRGLSARVSTLCMSGQIL